MPQPPNLLNDDGTASMATMLLMSHHAFRRDIARFIRAVAQIKAGDASRTEAVRDEWVKSYHQALHGHHMFEDANVFPDVLAKRPELGSSIQKLTEQHHLIDPMLAEGDAAFADLAHPERAEAVLEALKSLLDQHLALEEAEITPSLRDGKQFPTPPDEKAAAMYAEGFAWSMQGIAPEVLELVEKMLPDILTARLPAARAAFDEHCERVWGAYETGSATTPVPTAF